MVVVGVVVVKEVGGGVDSLVVLLEPFDIPGGTVRISHCKIVDQNLLSHAHRDETVHVKEGSKLCVTLVRWIRIIIRFGRSRLLPMLHPVHHKSKTSSSSRTTTRTWRLPDSNSFIRRCRNQQVASVRPVDCIDRARMARQVVPLAQILAERRSARRVGLRAWGLGLRRGALRDV